MMLSPRSRNPQERISAADPAYGGQTPEECGNHGSPMNPLLPAGHVGTSHFMEIAAPFVRVHASQGEER
jgi:hypothetical protein